MHRACAALKIKYGVTGEGLGVRGRRDQDGKREPAPHKPGRSVPGRRHHSYGGSQAEVSFWGGRKDDHCVWMETGKRWVVAKIPAPGGHC